MAGHSFKGYEVKRSDCLWFDPEDLVLVTDKESPFYDPRVELPVDDGLVQNILYNLQLIPIKGLDITPLSFSLIALVMALGISRNQLFDLMPIAREKLLNGMAEGVIVIDPGDTIIEFNPAAICTSLTT